MDDIPVTRLDVFSEDDGTVRLIGEIDAHTAPALDAVLVELPEDQDAVLDLEGVQFIDSSGLRIVVAAHHRLDTAGAKLLLRSPSVAFQRLVQISGLLETLHLESAEHVVPESET